MVAFIGAVICIIAAVHTAGSSKAGAAAAAAAAPQQPEADNQSLYTDSAAHGIPGGSSSGGARPGPLGALHGSETPESEAPTGFLHVGLSGGGLDAAVVAGGGLTGHDPRVSRLICTPMPAAGDCNPRNLFQQQQQQADEPPSRAYGGGGAEDAAGTTGYLRTAAEELRQTVSQQKDQILTDQRTIRELTGKLTECERGLDGRGGSSSSSSSERRPGTAAGLLRGRGGGRASSARKTMSAREVEEDGGGDGVMVRDSPGSAAAAAPEALHLLTVRAVDELELAITQLKDRIEKLELDIGPFQLNLTDANYASILPGGGGGQSEIPEERSVEPVEGGGPWTLEDLEGELQKKVHLLEKERKGLRLETQRHRYDIDQGIDKLHQRIAGLEDAGRPAFPEGYRLSFLSRTNYMYAVLKHPVPELRALTVCMWLRPAEGGIGTPVSYAVPAQPNELVLLQGLHTPVELLVNDKVAQLPLNLSRGSWQHICVSWSHKGGAWQAYQGGKLRGEGSNLATGHHVRPGGVLILGQEQDSPGGGFDSSQALVGELSQVALWDRVLTPSQVASLARCGRVTHGSVAPWTEKAVEVHGGATKEPGEPCSKHSRSSQ